MELSSSRIKTINNDFIVIQLYWIRKKFLWFKELHIEDEYIVYFNPIKIDNVFEKFKEDKIINIKTGEELVERSLIKLVISNAEILTSSEFRDNNITNYNHPTCY